MFQNNAKVLALLSVLVLGATAVLSLGTNPAGAQGSREETDKAALASLTPFAPEAGQHYQIFMPDGRPYLGVPKLFLIQKVYAHGWVEVQTPERQTAILNLNHAMQLYRIDDVQKWRKLNVPEPSERN